MTAIGTLKKIITIERSVRQAERKFVPPWMLSGEYANKRESFTTNGPRRSVYLATSLRSLLEIFKKVDLPKEGHFADLGSGLGMACFTASFYFRQVTGFEIDPKVNAAAEQIRQKFSLNNVRLINADFLNADLQPFDVIFMFRPFLDNLLGTMFEKLKETRPGTLVIRHGYNSDEVFYASLYKGIWKGFLDDINSGTFVYQRR